MNFILLGCILALSVVTLSSAVLIDLKPIKTLLVSDFSLIIPILSDQYNEIGSLEKLGLRGETEAFPHQINFFTKMLTLVDKQYKMFLNVVENQLEHQNDIQESSFVIDVPSAELNPYIDMYSELAVDFNDLKNHIESFINIINNLIDPQFSALGDSISGFIVSAPFSTLILSTIQYCGEVEIQVGKLMVNASQESQKVLVNNSHQQGLSRATIVTLNQYSMGIGQAFQKHGTQLLSYDTKNVLENISSQADYFDLYSLFAMLNDKLDDTRKFLDHLIDIFKKTDTWLKQI